DERDVAAGLSNEVDESDRTRNRWRLAPQDPRTPGRCLERGTAVRGALELVGRVVERGLVDVEYDCPRSRAVVLRESLHRLAGQTIDLPRERRVFLAVAHVLDAEVLRADGRTAHNHEGDNEFARHDEMIMT